MRIRVYQAGDSRKRSLLPCRIVDMSSNTFLLRWTCKSCCCKRPGLEKEENLVRLRRSSALLATSTFSTTTGVAPNASWPHRLVFSSPLSLCLLLSVSPV